MVIAIDSASTGYDSARTRSVFQLSEPCSPDRRDGRPEARGRLSTGKDLEELGAVAGMDTCNRSRLLQLAERLPDDKIQAATRYLEFLTSRGDPYLPYLMSAPEEEGALSEESRRLLDEGWEDIEAGRLVSSDEAKRELGL